MDRRGINKHEQGNLTAPRSFLADGPASFVFVMMAIDAGEYSPLPPAA